MFVFRKRHLFAALLILGLAVLAAGWPQETAERKTAPAAVQIPPASAKAQTQPSVSGIYTPEKGEEKEQPLVGVWIPYMSLMTPESTESAFRENFEEMLDVAEKYSVNAVFVHVRPFADSLYPSAYEPWSHILTGTQGEDPGYDPLAYMIGAAHRRGMQFHAWINPLRISTGQTPAVLSEESFYLKEREENPDYFIVFENGVYYNPGSADIRERIAESAAEIAEKYDVDGIHFDDYFYPAEEESIDAGQYEAYAESTEDPLPLHEWRTANINALIATVYHRIKTADPDVVFGISPQGNLRNNEKINADVYTWCAQRGYVDYICPQLYYSFENPALPYENALEEWLAMPRLDSVKFYVGLAVYKAGTDADQGTWLGSEEILKGEIERAGESGADGVLFYAIDHLRSEEAAAELANAQIAAKAFTER